MTKKKKSYYDGFIVHPYETTGGMYHASYGNQSKPHLFKTLTEAKSWLAKNNVKEAIYDSPSGTKDIKIKKQVKYKKQKNKKSSFLIEVDLPRF